MLNLEKLKKRLERFAKDSKEDKSDLWEQIDEIYGHPLIRAYYDGWEHGWCNAIKQVYVGDDKNQYQGFYDEGYEDGKTDRLRGDDLDEV